jgi:hypothetical protein
MSVAGYAIQHALGGTPQPNKFFDFAKARAENVSAAAQPAAEQPQAAPQAAQKENLGGQIKRKLRKGLSAIGDEAKGLALEAGKDIGMELAGKGLDYAKEKGAGFLKNLASGGLKGAFKSLGKEVKGDVKGAFSKKGAKTGLNFLKTAGAKVGKKQASKAEGVGKKFLEAFSS